MQVTLDTYRFRSIYERLLGAYGFKDDTYGSLLFHMKSVVEFDWEHNIGHVVLTSGEIRDIMGALEGINDKAHR